MLRNDEAILLNKQRLGESDLILTLLGEDTGLIRGVARSAMKSRKRFGGALEPLSRVRLEWSEKKGRDLQRIDTMELLESYADMQADPMIQACCGLIAEIVASLAGADDPDPRYFRLVRVCLDRLGAGLDPWVCVRYFELWSLRLHGMLPDLTRCGLCRNRCEGMMLLNISPHPALLCPECGRSCGSETRKLDPEDYAFLLEGLRLPPEDLAGYGKKCRPGKGLEWFLRSSLEQFAERKYKSYRHLAYGLHGRCG